MASLRTLPTSDHMMIGLLSEALAHMYYESGRLERAMEPNIVARYAPVTSGDHLVSKFVKQTTLGGEKLAAK